MPRDDDEEAREEAKKLLHKDGEAQKFAYVDIKSADLVLRTFTFLSHSA